MFRHGLLGKPPGPTGSPISGVYRPFRDSPADFLLGLSREYGDVAHFRVGFQQMYLLNQPDFIEEILVTSQANFVKSRMLQRAKILLGEGLLTSEGEFHMRQRKLMQPMFYRERLVRYAAEMVASAQAAQARWQPGETRDIAQEMSRLTLAIVGRTLFNRDVEHEAADVGKALTAVLDTFGMMMSPFSGLMRRLPLPAIRRADRARKYLDRTIYRMIEERRASGKDQGDLLSMLLLASDESEGAMTDKQVRDEALTLFLAGHETTATALTWTFYLLSQNPEAEGRLREELAAILGGRPPSFEDLPRLTYVEMVLAESMRLYPPVWAIGRMVKKQYRLYNYELAPGSICIMSPYVMHRHPRFYPEPERFDPERFTPEARQSRPKFAYFPFGGGPRVCIGERFAWMEGTLLLASIVQNWRMRLTSGQVVEPHPQITLRTRNGVKVVLEKLAAAMNAN
jgi:cytochrome P450